MTDIITLKQLCAELKLEPRERLTWGQAQQRILDNVPPGSLATLCAGCQWLDLGLCESALQDLHDSKA